MDVDDKSCPAVPTLEELSVNVDCNVMFEENISLPCDIGYDKNSFLPIDAVK